MTRLFNDPADFADEMVDGFAAANARLVRKVRGGVVRVAAANPGSVSVVIGGGSGHYPAFGGLVGPGLAAGAAMGNLFASPSAQQVAAVARSAQTGGGVLLAYGNYAGDVLNFQAAARSLQAEGIPVRTIAVTDDVASATPDKAEQRRGIAGDLAVFKIAGAAASEGADLDTVAELAERANARTRSFGVAFSGCSLPGAPEPLFTVPEGRMAVGMGIHGERGIDETDIPTADGLAELLVSRLLAEAPTGASADGARVVPILNGLGSVKYEELFVVYRRVSQLLVAAGVTVVEPEVGELVTSFDMAGVSLTLFWLDDELERLWGAPADTPAFRKGTVAGPDAAATDAVPPAVTDTDAESTAAEASPRSREAAERVAALLRSVAATVEEHVDELGRIDAVAGDGDHGIGMQRGSVAAAQAAQDALARGAGAGSVLAAAADAWSDRAGGTSGALWGAALQAIGTAIGDQEVPSADTVARGARDATAAILAFGAQVGDKTMVDALVPFSDTLSARVGAGDGLVEAWSAAAAAAAAGARGTAELLPRMGRARTHAEHAIGTPDAGAVSFALIVGALNKELAAVSAQL